MRAIRSAGVFLLNILIAEVGPLLAEYPLPHSLALRWSLWANIAAESAIAAVAGFSLGYGIYRVWRNPEMKWIWLPGAAWCGAGLLRAALEPHSVLDVDDSHKLNIYGGITNSDIQNTLMWTSYVMPFIRVLFYSLGATVMSTMHRQRDLSGVAQVSDPFAR